MSHDDNSFHVHDLPQIYTKPTFETLLTTLEQLKLVPTTFNTTKAQNEDVDSCSSKGHAESGGVPAYLTTVISSRLPWLETDDQRERIWELASTRLSERAGRTAMPSMTRSFEINPHLTIDLYEPSLTEDNLGFKTWTSSLLLARRLDKLRCHLPSRAETDGGDTAGSGGACVRVLELGAGTGLVGIAASCTWADEVHVVVLTDLPEIVPNLQKNVEANLSRQDRKSARMDVKALDWSDEGNKPVDENDRFMVVVAADPVYTSDHPFLLAGTVRRWICKSREARFIVELPLRKGYEVERDSLRQCLQENDMELIESGTELGFDDWLGSDGRPLEVECWWSVWRPKMSP